MGFFGGACSGKLCGAGCVLKVSSNHAFHLYFKAGTGTDTRTELLVLWCLLHFAVPREVTSLIAFGDSKCIVDWAKGISSLQSLTLKPWLIKVNSLSSSFDQLSINDIYREDNTTADILSKRILGIMDGILHVEEFLNGSLVESSCLDLL